MNIELEVQWEQIKTDMKNTIIDILGYEERKKDKKEWFDESVRQLLQQKNKAYQAYLARLTRANRAECKEKWKWEHTACKKKKTGYQSTINCN